MKKCVICVCALCVFLLLGGCVEFSEPAFSGETRIHTSFGDTFEVHYVRYNFPDEDISVGISRKGTTIMTRIPSSFKGMNQNTYANLLREYQDGAIRAYEFYWGIVYTVDDGDSFQGVWKDQHEQTQEENAEYKAVYEALRRNGAAPQTVVTEVLRNEVGNKLGTRP